MPRGKPNLGYRLMGDAALHKNGGAVAALQALPKLHIPAESNETEEQIDLKLKTRFAILEQLTDSVIEGDTPAVIISGPPGLGKSYSVERKLREWDPREESHKIAKGTIGSTGLYKLLHDYRENGEVIVFDDADTVFADSEALNLLKGACDSSDIRRVSWRKETQMVSDRWGTPLDRDFVFNGSIIFITNEDFDGKIARGHSLAPHFAALISRAHYIDLAMKTRKDYIVRIKQVLKEGMLRNNGFTQAQEDMIMEFVISHQDRLRELSLRIVKKVGDLVKTGKPNWLQIAELTCCKNT